MGHYAATAVSTQPSMAYAHEYANSVVGLIQNAQETKGSRRKDCRVGNQIESELCLRADILLPKRTRGAVSWGFAHPEHFLGLPWSLGGRGGELAAVVLLPDVRPRIPKI